MSAQAVVPAEARNNIWKTFNTHHSRVTFRLFTNRFGVRDSTVLSDFVEATFSGYIPPVADIGGADFTGGTHFNPPSSGSVTVYGVFVTFQDLGNVRRLLWAGNVFDEHTGWTDTPDGAVLIHPSTGADYNFASVMFGQE